MIAFLVLKSYGVLTTQSRDQRTILTLGCVFMWLWLDLSCPNVDLFITRILLIKSGQKLDLTCKKWDTTTIMTFENEYVRQIW